MPVQTPVLNGWFARVALLLCVVLGLSVVAPTSAFAKGGGKAEDEMIGALGTHIAHDDYAYGYPEAPDCDESTLSNGGCVGDNRGFYQGQCTSWVAHRLSQRNGISFSNWYLGRHWGDAVDWAKVAKSIGIKPDKTPSVGAVAWFKRGHVAYVEAVNVDGSIVMSEMNFDGHNGFRLVTVYPGYGFPDKFIHLADVIPYDATAPTTPGRPRVVTHHGRTGLAWRPSSDAFGVTGYRVLRNDTPLGTTTGTTFWDHQVTAGQTYVYSVVAYDEAGNVSAPTRVRVAPGREAVDRAWVSTKAGPALCGRTGSPRHQTVGCTLLTDRGWRRVPLSRRTPWGHASTRAFVEDDGGVSYCRTVGRLRAPALACTRLDAVDRTWGYDRVSKRHSPVRAEDATWVSTARGPAYCGRTGTERHQRVACSTLSSGAWHHARIERDARWGVAGTRSFIPAPDGTVSFCRTIGARPERQRLSCTPFDISTLTWGYDRISDRHRTGLAVDSTWVDTAAGPALCSTAGRAGCHVQTRTGWTRAELSRRAQVGNPASKAFVATADGGVAWCRTMGDPRTRFRAACSTLDPRTLTWNRDRRSPITVSTEVEDRTWVATPVGPALCGRTGRDTQQRIGCLVFFGKRWREADLGREVRWGAPDYRAFVPTPGGVGYCRTIGRHSAACTTLDAGSLRWRATRSTGRVTRTYADPF